MSDSTARIILGVVVGGTLLMRMYFNRKSVQAVSQDGVAWKESKLNQMARFLAGLAGIALMVVYVASPQSLAWASLPLPGWLRWAGVVMAVVGAGLLWWVQVSLGRNFSGNLHVLGNHQLVTHGPYRWVRHPMYSVFYVLFVSWFLITANALIGCLWIGVITLIVIDRLGHEEQVMVETFGDEYRQYMQRTGRLLPKLTLTGGR